MIAGNNLACTSSTGPSAEWFGGEDEVIPLPFLHDVVAPQRAETTEEAR
jgi:hypothetical protein